MSSNDHPMIDLSAPCDCGAIALSAKGKVISMFHCACENCQRVSGSGHSSAVIMATDAVSVAGATKTHTRPADSGATFMRHFCPECGTTIYGQSSRAPAFRILPAGLFIGHNDWFVPNQLIFARSHRHWDLIADHLPRHQRYREELT